MRDRHRFTAPEVYILGHRVEAGLYVHGMIGWTDPDTNVVHMHADDEDKQDHWTLCGQPVDQQRWYLVFSCLLDCEECGEAMARRDDAVRMPTPKATTLADQFYATQHARGLHERKGRKPKRRKNR